MRGVTRDRFEQLAVEALDSLPDWVQQRLENVEVIVEDLPPEDEPELLGLYEGTPLTERDDGWFGSLPDRITLFRVPLTREAGTEDELRKEIRETIVHEVAHFFGISDDRLHDLDRY